MNDFDLICGIIAGKWYVLAPVVLASMSTLWWRYREREPEVFACRHQTDVLNNDGWYSEAHDGLVSRCLLCRAEVKLEPHQEDLYMDRMRARVTKKVFAADNKAAAAGR